jgi:hypothetical protein
VKKLIFLLLLVTGILGGAMVGVHYGVIKYISMIFHMNEKFIIVQEDSSLDLLESKFSFKMKPVNKNQKYKLDVLGTVETNIEDMTKPLVVTMNFVTDIKENPLNDFKVSITLDIFGKMITKLMPKNFKLEDSKSKLAIKGVVFTHEYKITEDLLNKVRESGQVPVSSFLVSRIDIDAVRIDFENLISKERFVLKNGHGSMGFKDAAKTYFQVQGDVGSLKLFNKDGETLYENGSVNFQLGDFKANNFFTLVDILQNMPRDEIKKQFNAAEMKFANYSLNQIIDKSVRVQLSQKIKVDKKSSNFDLKVKVPMAKGIFQIMGGIKGNLESRFDQKTLRNLVSVYFYKQYAKTNAVAIMANAPKFFSATELQKYENIAKNPVLMEKAKTKFIGFFDKLSEAFLSSLVANGFTTKDGESYEVKAKFEQMAFTLNGKQIDIKSYMNKFVSNYPTGELVKIHKELGLEGLTTKLGEDVKPSANKKMPFITRSGKVKMPSFPKKKVISKGTVKSKDKEVTVVKEEVNIDEAMKSADLFERISQKSIDTLYHDDPYKNIKGIKETKDKEDLFVKNRKVKLFSNSHKGIWFDKERPNIKFHFYRGKNGIFYSEQFIMSKKGIVSQGRKLIFQKDGKYKLDFPGLEKSYFLEPVNRSSISYMDGEYSGTLIPDSTYKGDIVRRYLKLKVEEEQMLNKLEEINEAN